MAENSKKKLIRIKGLGDSSSGYGFSSMNFAFVSPPSDGRRQVSTTMTCREYVNRTVWAALHGRTTGQYNPDREIPFDPDCLRLLVVHDSSNTDAFKRKLFNGKAALNRLEHINNWKPSTITTVVHSNYKHAWLLTGPGEWLSQPQLLSLATWIMRLAAFRGPLTVDSYDALEKSLFDIQHSNSDGSSDTSTYAKQFWDKAYILLKYYKEIFKGITLEQAYPGGVGDTFGVYSGFLSFCRKESSYTKEVKLAQKRFHELCAKHLPRKNPLIKRR